jgi:hypothetical protein
MLKVRGGMFEVEGKSGGTVYRKDVCGQHAQAYPRIVNPYKETPQQKAFTRAKNVWMSHKWTPFELGQWWEWCQHHPLTNKKGEVGYFHPFLAFLHVNIKRILNGQDILLVPE